MLDVTTRLQGEGMAAFQSTRRWDSYIATNVKGADGLRSNVEIRLYLQDRLVGEAQVTPAGDVFESEARAADTAEPRMNAA